MGKVVMGSTLRETSLEVDYRTTGVQKRRNQITSCYTGFTYLGAANIDEFATLGWILPYLNEKVV